MSYHGYLAMILTSDPCIMICHDLDKGTMVNHDNDKRSMASNIELPGFVSLFSRK